MPKVAYCCCGCSLRDGTIILLVIDLIIGFIAMLLSISNFPIFMVHAVLMAVAGVGLYGVFKEKPDFIIAHMVVQILWFIVFCITMVAILLGGSVIIASVTKMTGSGKIPGSHGTEIAADSFGVLLLLELLIGLVAGLQFYFFVVVYSLYTKMKEGSTGHF